MKVKMPAWLAMGRHLYPRIKLIFKLWWNSVKWSVPRLVKFLLCIQLVLLVLVSIRMGVRDPLIR